MVEAFRRQQVFDGGAAPGHLAVAETRILGFHDLLQVLGQHQRGGLDVEVWNANSWGQFIRKWGTSQ